ncbi:MAG: hypothetical protein KDC43_27300, partial [Saprospiraceae bacterium]|nr:hypothetical protein [Saprospiraceae bacterium]
GPTPLVDAGGTYTLAVTNEENGCSNSAEVLVAQDQNLPTADAGQPGLLNCYDPVIILDGTASSAGPGLLYEWTTSDGSILSGANTLQPEVDAPGTYLLTVTDQGNGCVSSTNVLVAEDFQQPAADAGPGQELTCSITSLNLSGAGSTGAEFQYSWTTPDGNILSGADGPNPLIDAAGTYTLEVQNVDNGCSTTASTTVTDAVAFPLAVASLDGILTCAVQTLGLDGAGSDAGPNFTYQWSTIGGNILSGGNTLTPTVDLPGLYTLSVTDTSNDCVSTAEVQVPIDTLSPLAEAGPAGLLTCTVQALDLDAAGSSIGANFSYVWSTADGNILNGANTLNPAVDEPGTYQILVSNLDNGCTAVDQVAVGEDVTPPDAGSSVSGILTCAQTSLSLSGSGSSTGPNFGYQWTTADGNILSGAAGLSPVVDQPGTYQLTVLDQFNGCEANTAVVVQQDIVDPTVGVDMAGTLTCAITELSLQGQASGNNQPLTFQWSTADGSIQSGATSLSPLIDEPGTYELLVTDEVNGCTATAQVQVGQDVTPPNVAIVGPGELNCLQETVTIDATASSSGPDFQSNWTTTGGNILSGNGSLQIVVDQPGSYSLLIVNLINGCSSQTETAVMQDIEMPVVDAGDGFTLPCFEQTSELSGTASASGNNLAIEWQTADGQIEA